MKHISSRRHWLFLVCGVAGVAFLALYYYSYFYFNYPSAPGGDLYNHFLYIQALQDRGVGILFEGYPKLFHLAVLIVMKVTGLDALRVMLYMIPVILLSIALSCSWVAFILKGRNAALITFLLSLFVATQPTQTLYDGGFPNTIAAGIFAPLLIGSSILFIRNFHKKWLYMFFAVSLALVSTHAFTSLYAGVVICSLIFYYQRFWRKYALAVLVLLGLFFLTPFAQPILGIVSTVIKGQSNFPWFHIVGRLDNPNAIWRLIDYPEGIGYSIVYGGIIGFFYLIYWVKNKKYNAAGAYLLVIWVLLLFLGSRIEALGFPVRLARDLAIPLTISTGIVCAAIYEVSQMRIYAKATVILFLCAFSYHHFQYRLYRIRHYEPAMQYSNSNEQALQGSNGNSVAAIGQYLPYVVSQSAIPTFLSEDGILTEVDREKLKDRQYAFFEIRAGHNGELFRPLLVQDGFKEIQRFKDPLKTVILFQRHR